MKKKLVLITLFLSVSFNFISAQNLVINSSLENYITCPGFGQFDSIYINNWSKPSYGSTDYYHNNCSGIQPVSQVPHSGDAYLGVIAYNYGTEYREYATGQLSSPLTAGVQYTVDFYVSLNDGYIQAIDEMGAYFSPSLPGPFSNALHIPVTPQIQNSGMLSSITAWMHVTGTFIAAGGERYITIGNFNDDLNTTITQVGNIGSFGAYYFVDDVSVSPEPNGISDLVKKQNSIYPNPSTGIFNLHLEEEIGENFMYEATDCTGRLIFSGKISTERNSFDKTFDLSAYKDGIYFLKLNFKNKLIIYKLAKF